MLGMYLLVVVGYVIHVECQDSDLNYKLALLDAQCTSKCLELYGDPNPYPVSTLYNIYTAKGCLNSYCRQCTKTCEESLKRRHNTTCFDVCKSSVLLDVCQLICEFVKVQLLSAGSEVIKDKTSSVSTSEPTIVCSYTDGSNTPGKTHVSTVYLKWDMRKMDLKVLPQMQFVISLQKPNDRSKESEWTSIGKTGSSFLPIHNLTLNTTYRFKVTAVSEKGVVDDTKMTQFITTLPDNYVPNVAENVKVEIQTYYKHAVSAKISWDAAKDKSCFYKIFWLPSCKNSKAGNYVQDEMKELDIENDLYQGNSLKSIAVRIDNIRTSGPVFLSRKDTPPDFEYWVNRLQFDCNYTVSIYSYPTAMFSRGSDGTMITFQTLGCLNATKFNYTVCNPEEPRNISATLTELYMTDGLVRGNITFVWETPPHVGPNNKLTGYILEWTKRVPLHMGPLVDPDKGSLTLFPNQSSYVIPEMHWNSEYRIQIRATSIGGTSDPITTFVDLGVVDYSDNLTNTTSATILGMDENKVFIGSAVTVAIVITSAAILLFRHTNRKRHAFKVRGISRMEESNPLYDNSWVSFGRDSPIILDKYEVEFSHLLLLNTLGEGAFGKVVKAELSIPGKHAKKVIVAVKMLKDHPDVVERRSLLKEIEAMKQLGPHPNIVSIIGCCTKKDNHVCLIMNYCPLGDLRQYLHRLRPQARNESSPDLKHKDSGLYSDMTEDENESCTQPLTQTRLLSYARQIAMGMEYLAEKKYVHRDLAARNILMCDIDRLKLSDFGLTRDVYETNMYQPTSARKLPYKWMAIEAICDQIFTTKSDVWSFGIVMWEIITLGGSPYPGIPNEDLYRLLKDGYRMENPGNCSADIYELMLSCWHPKPQGRPAFIDLRQKLEAMLEFTEAYINLSVSVSDDYYNSDSFSSKDDTKDRNSEMSYLEEKKQDKNHQFSHCLAETDTLSLVRGGYHNVFVNEHVSGKQPDLCKSMCRFCNIPLNSKADSKLSPDRASNLYEEPVSLMLSGSK